MLSLWRNRPGIGFLFLLLAIFIGLAGTLLPEMRMIASTLAKLLMIFGIIQIVLASSEAPQIDGRYAAAALAAMSVFIALQFLAFPLMRLLPSVDFNPETLFGAGLRILLGVAMTARALAFYFIVRSVIASGPLHLLNVITAGLFILMPLVSMAAALAVAFLERIPPELMISYLQGVKWLEIAATVLLLIVLGSAYARASAPAPHSSSSSDTGSSTP